MKNMETINVVVGVLGLVLGVVGAVLARRSILPGKKLVFVVHECLTFQSQKISGSTRMAVVHNDQVLETDAVFVRCAVVNFGREDIFVSSDRMSRATLAPPRGYRWLGTGETRHSRGLDFELILTDKGHLELSWMILKCEEYMGCELLAVREAGLSAERRTEGSGFAVARSIRIEHRIPNVPKTVELLWWKGPTKVSWMRTVGNLAVGCFVFMIPTLALLVPVSRVLERGLARPLPWYVWIGTAFVLALLLSIRLVLPVSMRNMRMNRVFGAPQ